MIQAGGKHKYNKYVFLGTAHVQSLNSPHYYSLLRNYTQHIRCINYTLCALNTNDYTQPEYIKNFVVMCCHQHRNIFCSIVVVRIKSMYVDFYRIIIWPITIFYTLCITIADEYCCSLLDNTDTRKITSMCYITISFSNFTLRS